MSQVNGMKQGYGTPIIIVRDREGKTIANSAKKDYGDGKVDNGKWGFNDYDISLSPTMFEYEYIDDDAHQCKITFETQDERLADHPALQEASNLKVTWGYVEGDKVTQEVIISGSTFRYLNDKMILEIKAESQTNARTKRFKTAQTNAKRKADSILSFIDWINIRLGGADEEVVFYFDESFSVQANQFQKELDKKINKTTLEANVRGFGLQKVGDETGATRISIFELPVTQNGQSVKNTIKQTTAKAKNGPYYVEEEDRKIIIHNRDKSFSQDAIRYFTYRGAKGDLLNFMPTISDKSEYIENVVTQVLDEKKKEQSTSSTNSVNANSSSPTGGQNGGSIKAQEDEEQKKLFDDLLAEFEANGQYSKFFIGLSWIELGFNTDTSTATNASTITTLDSLGNILNFQQNTTIESTAVQVRTRKFIKARSEMLSYLGKIDELEQQAINKVRENEQLATTARIRVIGDPLLRSRKIIHISGVSTKYGGKHYLMKAKHSITPMGYYVDMETIAQGRQEARIVASFSKLVGKITNPTTGEVKIDAKYSFERGVRDDFLIDVIRRRKNGQSLKQVIVEAYNYYYGKYSPSGEEKIVLEEIRKLILLELKKTKAWARSEVELEAQINEGIFGIEGVTAPTNSTVIVYPAGNPAKNLFNLGETLKLQNSVKIKTQ